MNVVIYSEDLEPITVLDLPLELLDKVARDGLVQLRVTTQNPLHRNDQVCVLKYQELLAKDGGTVGVLTTGHETAALRAKPGWLPGQLGTVNHYLSKISRLIKQRPNEQ